MKRAGSTHTCGTGLLSNGACSVIGPEGQRAVRPGAHPHRAHGRERWPLPEVVRESIKEEVSFGA